jgi:hypothetical protein
MADSSERMAGPDQSDECYGLVTMSDISDRGARGSNYGVGARIARTGHFAARGGEQMASTTPEWSDLASQNERLVDDRPSGAATPAVKTGPGRHRGAPAPRRSLWRSRTARGAAAGAAAALAVTGVAAGQASAATTDASWHIVQRAHAGIEGSFTAIVATSRTGGWAFSGMSKPTAWKRNGSSWVKASFPGQANESVVSASATSPTNVWVFTSGFPNSRVLHYNGHAWSVSKTFKDTIGSGFAASPSNVFAFGLPGNPGNLGTWHFNGHKWSPVSGGSSFAGGAGLPSGAVWAFGGTNVAHWNGHSFVKTSVKGLLPAHVQLNGPSVTSMYLQSKSSVWAVGDGNREDEGGSVVVLHYNGSKWSKSASLGGTVGVGYQNTPQLAPDGHGGLWIPLSPSSGGTNAHFLHYSGGHLTVAALPVASDKIYLDTVSAIPGTSQSLAAGFTHGASSLDSSVVDVILQDS